MTSNPIRYFVVDAFTDRPFSGNPAAVVPLDHWKEDSWLQNVAMEMNLAETAFFVRSSEGYDLRWFTPKTEVDLCGHATLASAVVLTHLGKLADGAEVVFSTKSGPLGARRQGSRIQLDFPLLDVEPSDSVQGLSESLGVTPRFVGKSKFDLLVEVESESVLRSLTPDFKKIATLPCRGVIVTARSSAECNRPPAVKMGRLEVSGQGNLRTDFAFVDDSPRITQIQLPKRLSSRAPSPAGRRGARSHTGRFSASSTENHQNA